MRSQKPYPHVNVQLQELSIVNSQLQGGWAVAAWPNVRKLTWSYASDLLNSYLGDGVPGDSHEPAAGMNPADSAKSAFQTILQQLCARFRNLKSLILKDVPELSLDVLELVEQHQLQYLELQSIRCVVDPPPPPPPEAGYDSVPIELLWQLLQQRLPAACIYVDVLPAP